jgi:hypothetical protein
VRTSPACLLQLNSTWCSLKIASAAACSQSTKSHVVDMRKRLAMPLVAERPAVDGKVRKDSWAETRTTAPSPSALLARSVWTSCEIDTARLGISRGSRGHPGPASDLHSIEQGVARLARRHGAQAGNRRPAAAPGCCGVQLASRQQQRPSYSKRTVGVSNTQLNGDQHQSQCWIHRHSIW